MHVVRNYVSRYVTELISPGREVWYKSIILAPAYRVYQHPWGNAIIAIMIDTDILIAIMRYAIIMIWYSII